MINVKELVTGGYDPGLPSPRRFREEGSAIINPDTSDKRKGWNKIDATEVLEGLYGIAQEYDDAVKAKAKKYAEDRYHLETETDDELSARAKEYADGIYEGKQRALEENLNVKTRDLNAQKSDYGVDRAAALRDLKKSYGKAESDLLEGLSRKGLTHSSIGDLSRESLLAEHREAVQRTERGFDRKVEIIDRKIEQANAAYETALKNYEISYAIRMENKLNKLRDERDRAVQTYEREHTEDREKAYKSYLFRNESQNKQYENEHFDYTGDKKENYQARYDYLVGALAGRNKEAVAEFLSQNAGTLKEYLGLYYDRFIKEVS